MPTVDILSPAGEKAGSVDLPDDVFDVHTNIPLIHQVVVGQLAAARQGTASTKTRARCAVVVASRTSRRAPAAPVRVRPEHRSSSAVVSFTDRSLVTIASGRPRR